MPTYARIQDGVVAELLTTRANIQQMFHPALHWVDVTALSPQPALGWVYAGGTFAPAPPPPPPPAPTPAQAAAAAFAQGCRLVSRGTAALNGRYALDPASQANVIGVQTRINAGLGLPLGAATIDWPDADGGTHTLTAAQFTALATALSDYVYLVDQFGIGAAATLPPQPYTVD